MKPEYKRIIDLFSSKKFTLGRNPTIASTGDDLLTMCVRQRNSKLLEFLVRTRRIPMVFSVSKQNVLWLACFENIVEMIEPIIRLSKTPVCSGEDDVVHAKGRCVRYKKKKKLEHSRTNCSTKVFRFSFFFF